MWRDVCAAVIRSITGFDLGERSGAQGIDLMLANHLDTQPGVQADPALVSRSVDSRFDELSPSSSSRSVVALRATRWRAPIQKALPPAALADHVLYNQIEDE